MVSIGDNVDFFLRADAQAEWNSNIALVGPDNLEDYIYRFTPGLEIAIGRGATNADATLVIQQQIVRYDDYDRFDSELFSIVGDASWRGSRLSLEGDAGFTEQQSNNNLTLTEGDLVESNNYRFNASGEYSWTQKISTGGGIRYSDTNYENFEDTLNDRWSWAVPLDVYYKITPKLDISGGYRYREVYVDDGFNTSDHFLNVGARGELAPKLTGQVRIGYQLREFDDRPGTDDETEALSFDSSLVYEPTPKVRVTGSLSKDFDVSGTGNNVDRTRFFAEGAYAYNPYLNFGANAGYDFAEFSRSEGREDDTLRLGVFGVYDPNEMFQVRLAYNFTENYSTLAALDYEQHVVTLSGSFRY